MTAQVFALAICPKSRSVNLRTRPASEHQCFGVRKRNVLTALLHIPQNYNCFGSWPRGYGADCGVTGDS